VGVAGVGWGASERVGGGLAPESHLDYDLEMRSKGRQGKKGSESDMVGRMAGIRASG
jgi:hypothetical protein